MSAGAVPVAALLVVLAGLDGMFAGFRASRGRTGVVRHRQQDALALRRGLGLGALLLAPVVALVLMDVVRRPDRIGVYGAAGRAMLSVYLPYGVAVLLAIAAYLTLGWRSRFRASAVLLGPLTLVRPLVAVAGGLVACWVSRDVLAGALALAAVGAVLAVEPAAGHRWYAVAALSPGPGSSR